MTKGERRKARKLARVEGRELTGELALDKDMGPVEFSESPRGNKAREDWARWYDGLNGAPESEGDR